jgi:hypothetical protein
MKILLAAWLILAPIGILGLAVGWVAYRARNARRLFGDQLLLRMFPGVLCGLPVAGAGTLGVLISTLLPVGIRLTGLMASCLLALVGVIMFGWCPKALLPRWQRESDDR